LIEKYILKFFEENTTSIYTVRLKKRNCLLNLQLLSKGTFGNIYLKASSEGEDSVIKISHTGGSNDKQPLLNADFFLRYLHQDSRASSWIVNRLGILESHGKIGLVTEHLKTNLREHLDRQEQGFSLDQTEKITRQLARALHFLDESGVLYINLCPSNILVGHDDQTVKLGNLEQACFTKNACVLNNYRSKRSYRSPELLLGMGPGSSSPIWSLGLIIMQLFTKAMISSNEKKEIIASHTFLLNAAYPETLVNKASSLGKLDFNKSFSAKSDFSETLPELIGRVSLEKTEDLERSQLLLDLLLKIFAYGECISAREILEHSFFKENETIEDTPTLFKKPKSLIGKFNFGEEIGSGSFGSIKKGSLETNGTQVEYARKESIPGNFYSNESIFDEYKFLRLLARDSRSSESIVQCFDLKSINNQFFLFLELMSTNLHQYIKLSKQLSLLRIESFSEQILKGLTILHDLGIIHLDLKPQNILVSEDGNTIKLADFGSSCFEEKACHPYGFDLVSLWWRAPEVILQIPLTKACDIWSFGVVVVEMFTGRCPFEVPKGNPSQELCYLIKLHEKRIGTSYPDDLKYEGSQIGRNQYDMSNQYIARTDSLEDFLGVCSEENFDHFLALIQKALEFHPKNRSTPQELLKEPFFLKEEEEEEWEMDP